MKKLNLNKAIVVIFIIFFFLIAISFSSNCIAMASCMHQAKNHSNSLK